MQMKFTFGHPVLIFIYSLAMFLMGDAIGIFWRNEPVAAFSMALLGASLTVLHDTAMTLIWLWATARWIQTIRGRKS